jgi:hypothetical protein
VWRPVLGVANRRSEFSSGWANRSTIWAARRDTAAAAVLTSTARWLPVDSAVVERSTVQHFLDAYRAAFEALDVEAIVDLFSYPCQITSDAGEVTVTRVATRAAWVPQIDRLVAAYREIGVRTAEVLEFDVMELTSRLAQVSVHWRLGDGEGRSIYDFDASYTVADRGDGLRITAIAHNEVPRLRAAVERQRPN